MRQNLKDTALRKYDHISLKRKKYLLKTKKNSGGHIEKVWSPPLVEVNTCIRIKEFWRTHNWENVITSLWRWEGCHPSEDSQCTHPKFQKGCYKIQSFWFCVSFTNSSIQPYVKLKLHQSEPLLGQCRTRTRILAMRTEENTALVMYNTLRMVKMLRMVAVMLNRTIDFAMDGMKGEGGELQVTLKMVMLKQQEQILTRSQGRG